MATSKELQAKIEALESENESLRAQLNDSKTIDDVRLKIVCSLAPRVRAHYAQADTQQVLIVADEIIKQMGL